MPAQEDSADTFVLPSIEHDKKTSHKNSFSTITGDAEAPKLQVWKGRDSEDTWFCSEDLELQVNKIQNGWHVLPCQRTCLLRAGLAWRSTVLWASHKHSLSTKPSWKPHLVLGAQWCCSNQGSPQSSVSTWRPMGLPLPGRTWYWGQYMALPGFKYTSLIT